MGVFLKKLRYRVIAAGMAAFFSGSFVSLLGSSVSAASGTITGNIQCFYGNNQVVGVLVDAASGADGFASLTNDGMGGKNYSYTLSTPSNYKLYVGCSGTPSSWGSSMQSPWVSGNSYNWVCSYSSSYGFFCAMS